MVFQPAPKAKTEADETTQQTDKDKDKGKEEEEEPPAGDVHLSKLGGGIIILIWAAGFVALTVSSEVAPRVLRPAPHAPAAPVAKS